MSDLLDVSQASTMLRQMLPLYESIGLTVEHMSDVLECSVPFSRHNQNHLGTLHAGVQWSAAEMLGGLLYMTHMQTLGNCSPVVCEVSIKFLKAATSRIRARTRFDADQVQALKATLDSENKAFFDLNIELLDDADLVVSTVVAKYRYRRVNP
ncbi:YiiD C-terminal domain-containing protein [Pseudomonas sp. NFIX28]|uniref:YiiD C-terminal domain-containing protein n=1 Tax=Pseudomonas sp. NFIX28 TaxID=1566235 RepID=UPI00089423EE|nr:YiiD C-terminal domain-containing protein [Pseudomonas sp. NFIX28]SDY43538.1 Acyl-coenzyme A thioesterase PaaI, contains HGG motif [Pseudomonas sp. NFIX28]